MMSSLFIVGKLFSGSAAACTDAAKRALRLSRSGVSWAQFHLRCRRRRNLFEILHKPHFPPISPFPCAVALLSSFFVPFLGLIVWR
ncbi:hypothetical protein TgHK011_003985 [Trichoderma gracile]|nr:hypothetical protein TgHK011_003985 [Trichoderma gracile]